jgi:hypothetical protein
MAEKYNASLDLENLTIINNRHIWLWHITSENGVLDHWLLQWEEPSKEIIDKLFYANEAKLAYHTYVMKTQEIAYESVKK